MRVCLAAFTVWTLHCQLFPFAQGRRDPRSQADCQPRRAAVSLRFACGELRNVMGLGPRPARNTGTEGVVPLDAHYAIAAEYVVEGGDIDDLTLSVGPKIAQPISVFCSCFSVSARGAERTQDVVDERSN